MALSFGKLSAALHRALWSMLVQFRTSRICSRDGRPVPVRMLISSDVKFGEFDTSRTTRLKALMTWNEGMSCGEASITTRWGRTDSAASPKCASRVWNRPWCRNAGNAALYTVSSADQMCRLSFASWRSSRMMMNQCISTATGYR